MRIGLVTDIHNHSAELARALGLFRDSRVDQVVTIGDTCDAFGRGDGAGVVASLLDGCGAVGVWGNHDFTLCRDVPAAVRERYAPVVLDVMARMQPRLVVGDCHFSHKEASVDPHDVAQLWDVSDRPLDLLERAGRAFAESDSPWQFVGHYHRWWAATPEGPVGWSGTGPLRFRSGQRYFVVVAAVCDGWCGILDTELGQLEPLQCGPAELGAAADRAGTGRFRR
jgi:Calcineurin-like phosphoesterase superfamily domain